MDNAIAPLPNAALAARNPAADAAPLSRLAALPGRSKAMLAVGALSAAEPSSAERDYLAGNYSSVIRQANAALRDTPAPEWTSLLVRSLLATGRNARQTGAIFDEVHGRLKQEAKLLPRAVDGQREGDWIIADYLDVVLHVFTPETREFYRLEDLWGDVPAVEVEAATA